MREFGSVVTGDFAGAARIEDAWRFAVADDYSSGNEYLRLGRELQAGHSIAANEITFGLTDWLGVTESSRYQGGVYDWSRASARLAREAALAAATMGLGQAFAACRVGSGVLRFGKALYLGDHGRTLSLLVRGGMAYMGYRGVVGGVDRAVAGWDAALEGDPTGYVDILAGGFQVVGGLSALKTAFRTGRPPCFIAGTEVIMADGVIPAGGATTDAVHWDRRLLGLGGAILVAGPLGWFMLSGRHRRRELDSDEERDMVAANTQYPLWLPLFDGQ